GAANRTSAAADPRIDNIAVARTDALRFGSDGGYRAGDLMAHGDWWSDAAIGQRKTLAAAQLVITIVQMKIAVTDAGRQRLQQHLGALRLRRRRLDCGQRLAEFGQDVAFHGPASCASLRA